MRNARQQLRAERQELLDLGLTLSPAEWDAPSLCAGWRVRDVLAHLCGNDHDFFGDILAVRGNLDAANALAVERRRAWPIGRLLDEWASLVPVHGAARLFAMLLIMDNWIHQEDIRRALDRPRPQHPERVAWVLRLARVAPYSRGKQLTLVATDLDLTLGRGPAVYGAAADLIMAITGRRDQLAVLDGPGVVQLGE